MKGGDIVWLTLKVSQKALMACVAPGHFLHPSSETEISPTNEHQVSKDKSLSKFNILESLGELQMGNYRESHLKP